MLRMLLHHHMALRLEDVSHPSGGGGVATSVKLHYIYYCKRVTNT
jgi:hypothetical protein